MHIYKTSIALDTLARIWITYLGLRGIHTNHNNKTNRIDNLDNKHIILQIF